MGLEGLRVVGFESRRAELVETLVRQQGGDCFNAPSVREIPLEANEAGLGLIRDLIAGRYDALVLTTGVGAAYLIDAARAIGEEQRLLDALRRTVTVSRGPKPAAVLRQCGAPATRNVPEPNTWRETAEAMRDLPVRRVAIQEYGVQNPEFVAALEEIGFEAVAVPVYRWTLPGDVGPVEEAVRRIAGGRCDIALLLSSVQLVHAAEIAGRLGLREALLGRLRDDVVVASIGPVMTEALARFELVPDFEPKHPKLAICIRQLADEAPRLVAAKRDRRR